MTNTMNVEKAYMEVPANLPLMIDPKTAAALTGLSDAHIRRECVKGNIKAVKSGSAWRINRDAILAQFGLSQDV